MQNTLSILVLITADLACLAIMVFGLTLSIPTRQKVVRPLVYLFVGLAIGLALRTVSSFVPFDVSVARLVRGIAAWSETIGLFLFIKALRNS